MKIHSGVYIIVAVVLALTVACLLGAPSYAEELPAEVLHDEGGIEIPPETESEPQSESNGFAALLARAVEFVETYVDEIAGIVSAVATAVAMAIFSAYQKHKDGAIFSGIKRLISSHGSVETESQGMRGDLALVKADMAEQKKYYLEYSKNEAERNKVTAALLVEVMTLVEIMHIAYINNSNIPQSMKNLMTTKYAKMLSVIDNDAELKAAYNEMKGILGISEAMGDEKKAR